MCVCDFANINATYEHFFTTTIPKSNGGTEFRLFRTSFCVNVHSILGDLKFRVFVFNNYGADRVTFLMLKVNE